MNFAIMRYYFCTVVELLWKVTQIGAWVEVGSDSSPKDLKI